MRARVEDRQPQGYRGRLKRSALSPAQGALAVPLICLLLLAAGALLPGVMDRAHAADERGANKVVLFEDLTVGSADTLGTLVVVGGDVVVQGTITDIIVVVGGDLRIESTAVVGSGVWKEPGDDAVVSVFGDLTIEPGAGVTGTVSDVLSGVADGVQALVVEPALRPWRVGTPLGLVWGFVIFIVVMVVVASIAPRQVAFVRDRVRRHFFSSLGWGVLGTFVGIPLSVVALILSIVGILALAPWLAVVLPLTFLFGVVAVTAWMGGVIMRAWDGRRTTVLPSVIIGAVILSALRFIPGAGSVIVFLTCMVGFGATFTAIWEWRRRARAQTLEEAAHPQAAAVETAGPPAPDPDQGVSNPNKL